MDKTPNQLMLAAYYGHADLVKLLIQHGADPNRLNDKNQSPLAGAVFKKEDEVIDVSCHDCPRAATTNYLHILAQGIVGGWCGS